MCVVSGQVTGYGEVIDLGSVSNGSRHYRHTVGVGVLDGEGKRGRSKILCPMRFQPGFANPDASQLMNVPDRRLGLTGRPTRCVMKRVSDKCRRGA